MIFSVPCSQMFINFIWYFVTTNNWRICSRVKLPLQFAYLVFINYRHC